MFWQRIWTPHGWGKLSLLEFIKIPVVFLNIDKQYGSIAEFMEIP